MPPPSEGAWRDPRTGQWQGGQTTSWQDVGTSQWQATGTGAWGGAPSDPADPVDGPPPPRPGRTPLLAPLVALVGLILIAGGSVFAAAKLDLVGGAAATATPIAVDVTEPPGQTFDPTATDTPGPVATPRPQQTPIVTPPPNEVATVPGTLLYVRDGDIYAFSGTTSTQLSDQGTDSSPTWSEDGKTIYFVRTKVQRGVTPPWGKDLGPFRAPSITHYATDIMSMDADGSNRQRLFTSMFKNGKGYWSTVAIQPDISPDGKTIVLASDGRYVPSGPAPDTDSGAVVLSTMSSTGKNLESMGIDYFNSDNYTPPGSQRPGLEPGWQCHRVHLFRQGWWRSPGPGSASSARRSRSTRLTCRPRAADYANPSWSPDGRYLAAERVTKRFARHRDPGPRHLGGGRPPDDRRPELRAGVVAQR